MDVPIPASSPATARPPASCPTSAADETPHVDYLRTALSEMRDRTWVGEGGRRHAGSDMIGRIWEPLLTHSLGPGRDETRRAALGEVEYWCARHRNGADLLAEFRALGAA